MSKLVFLLYACSVLVSFPPLSSLTHLPPPSSVLQQHLIQTSSCRLCCSCTTHPEPVTQTQVNSRTPFAFLLSVLLMDTVIAQYKARQKWKSNSQLETIKINNGWLGNVSKNISVQKKSITSSQKLSLSHSDLAGMLRN